MILLIGCSLGAGPGQCNPLVRDAIPGLGSGSASIPPPTPPPPPLPPTTPPPAAPPRTSAPRRDEPTAREALVPKPPPAAPHIVVPDEVIVTAVRALQPTFAACWKRAQRADPSLTSARVRLSLEVDASGTVTSSRTDAEDEKLSRCLSSVARKLAFPSLGRPAAFDVPLLF